MPIKELTHENFDEVVRENDIVLVDFWASWCAPCMAFGEVYAATAENHPDIVFGKVNTEEEAELAADFAIRSIPTLMIIRQSVVIYSESGAMPATALEDLIKQAKNVDMSKLQTPPDSH